MGSPPDSALLHSRIHSYVFGRVQGVAFRYYTKKRAETLFLTGWVRNLRDGRVEVCAEGAREDLEMLLFWLKKGPPMASVEKIETFWQESKGSFDAFTITY